MKQQLPSQTQPIYTPDILPTTSKDRTWRFGQFFSVWMGSVHNIPSYVTVGGFFALGLSVWEVFFIILIASILLACLLILNGHAGSKYGIPFSILLRSSYGQKGAIFPGILRGVIAAIMWFGMQTYAGSIALTILIGSIWPEYLTLGGSWNIFGLSLSGILSFIIFWLFNITLIFGGMNTIGFLTKILTPFIFIVFGSMSIWSIQLAGGLGPILSYAPSHTMEGNSIFLFIICISAILSTWVAPILSVSDLTRFSHSYRDQSLGQIIGLLCTYLLFAFASICIIIGSEVAFGTPIWNVLDVVEKFNTPFAVILSLGTICLATLSVNIVGNLIPAGYQLSSLFPKILTFRTSALLAACIGIMIMPWKLMEDSTSIFTFLNLVGGLLSPVIGVMLTHYYIISRKKLEVDRLYYPSKQDKAVNSSAITATLFAGMMSLGGSIFTILKPLNEVAMFSGIIIAAFTYFVLYYTTSIYINRNKREVA